MQTSDRQATVTLPSDEEILITREFDAPPELVWKAWTTPDLVRRWWPGRQGRMTVVEMDLRVGGRWRYAMEAEGGHEVAFNGDYLEVEPGRRLVNTEAYEAMPGLEPAVVTTTFRAAGDAATVVEMLIRMPSREARDGLLSSGMETGMRQQMELIDEIAGELR